MIIVNSGDFSANQIKYLSLAKAGENIFLKAKNGLFRILPAADCEESSEDVAFENDFRVALSEIKGDLTGTKPLKDVNSLWNEL